MAETSGPERVDEALTEFLLTEQRASRRSMLLLHELTVEERVAKGVTLTDLHALDPRKEKLRFHFPLQPCKLREGDWMVLGQGRPVGPEIVKGTQVIVSSVDPLSRTVELEPVGEFWELPELEKTTWTLDYLSSDMNVYRLINAVRASLAQDERLVALLGGTGWSGEKRSADPPPDLDGSQTSAAGEALSEPFTLIHGPPGTGKTRVLAAIIRALLAEERTVLVSAFTHRAIDNVLHAVHAFDANLKVVKLGRRSPDLSPAVSAISPHRLKKPDKPMIVGATVYAIARLSPYLLFDTVVIDEAGQLPLAHAVIPMARGRAKLVMAGDHYQLPPVLSGEHKDSPAATSVFAHLAALYPDRLFLLDTSYRLPPTLCVFPSRLFYRGRLQSCQAADPVLPELPENRRYPELTPVWQLDGPKRALWVNHLGYGAFSPPEAELVARSVASLIADVGFKPEGIAVVAPHRAQVREIADRLWKHVGPNLASRIIVDTVERMQGQERDVVLLSLCASDPWFLQEEIEFILSPNRLNVSITRSRQLLLVVGSRVFFRTFPKWPEHLELSALFRAFEKDLLPVSVDFTEQAHRWVGLEPPPPELLALPALNTQSVG